MKYSRWYDKYPELKSLLALLEQVNDEHIDLIAQDFLQIIMEKYGSNFDEKIVHLNENAPPGYKRWYDENYNLHTCIEFIKTLNDNEKKDLVNSFIMALMSFITNVDQG
ncbi:MAG: hypothetical protein ACI37R_02860 [Candidatus Avigastranaerophilus sp.]